MLAPRAASPTLIAPPVFEDQATPRGFALPDGCKLDAPVRIAKVAAGTQLAAPKGALDELAIALGEAPKTNVRARGLFKVFDSKARDVPWVELRNAPVLARAGAEFLALSVDDPDGDLWRASLYREDGSKGLLGRGDRLMLRDLTCEAERCAALTTLARPVLVPGASVFLGSPREPASRWRRVDIEAPPGRDWQPVVILAVSDAAQRAQVVLAGTTSVARFAITSGTATLEHEKPAEFGIYTAVLTPGPIAIGPGARADLPCSEDRFPLSILRIDIQSPARLQVQAQAAPQKMSALPLTRGALVVWLAPVGCRARKRKIVYALLLGPDGSPRGAPMPVADATSFALATDENRISLWLRTEAGLVWLRATCEPESSGDSGRDLR